MVFTSTAFLNRKTLPGVIADSLCSPLFKGAATKSVARGILLPPYQGGLGGIPISFHRNCLVNLGYVDALPAPKSAEAKVNDRGQAVVHQHEEH